MEVSQFVIGTVTGLNQLAPKFFVEVEGDSSCTNCNEQFTYMHPTSTGRMWCADCYVKRYCDIDRKEKGFQIVTKKSGQILFSSFPIIEKS